MPRPSILDDPDAIRSRQAEIAIEERRGCERCGSAAGVSRGPRGCAYHYEGTEGDANDPNYANLCPPCWVEEREYWDEMWKEYYSGRL
jgi:hypothetical protein